MFSNRDYSKNIDYSKCILCQKSKKNGVNGAIVDPSKARNMKPEECYKLIIQVLTKGDRYSTIPFYLSRFLKSDNAALILEENKAVWHKACRLKYGKQTNVLAPMHLNIAHSVNHNYSTTVGQKTCLFCDESKSTTKPEFHSISKSSTYDKIKKSAQLLQENDLLVKLGTSINDLKTMDYHLKCITNLYNRSKLAEKQASGSNTDVELKREAYTDLCVYIERMILNDEQFIFRLTDLKDLFTVTMGRLGISSIEQASALSRLNIEILKTFPLLQEFKNKDGTFLAMESAISSAIAYKWQHINDDNSIFSEIATIVRNDICDLDPRKDNDLIHQEESISKKLQKLMTMILQGNKNVKNLTANSNQGVLSVCQIIQHNTRKRSGFSGIKKRHQVEYETPLTRYVALLVHSLTRRKAIVNKLSKLGLCINYSRVLQINTNVGNAICDLYTKHKVVCPPHLPKGRFVTTAVDNVDHNLSSTGSKGSFHGTSISINVHPSNDDILPETERLPVFEKNRARKMKTLPKEYTSVDSYEIPDLENITFPTYNVNYQRDANTLNDALKTEQEWLSWVKIAVDDDKAIDISWAAFFGHRSKDKSVVVDHTALLPLIHENVNSPSTIRHAMKLAIKNTEYLNSGQSAVLTGDQPVYAIAKEIQWFNPEEFGEEKMTIMFGGLHIEKTYMTCIGDWLKGSEWDVVLAEAKIFTSGTAQSCLHASHITNTRLAHQVTAAVLHIMKLTEFKKTGLPEASFDRWEQEQEKNNPQFLYWNITLKLELILLIFVKLIRERDFSLYITTLLEMIPWFFVLDHPNYARWISVHIRDVQNLQTLNPGIWKHFNEGKFVVQKTKKCFSAMAIDQCHEQHNGIVKGDSGVIGLTNNVSAVARWIVAGPEITRLIKEFEVHYGLQDDYNNLHHDMTPASQRNFSTHVKNLLAVFESAGNPFMPDPDLVSLISKFKFNEESIQSIRDAKSTGLAKYEEFVASRFVKKTKSVADPIKTTGLKLMREKPIKKTNFASKKLKAIKNDRNLFMGLFVQAQHRSIDLDDFFSRENQPFPPSISDNGHILKYVKTSDIIDCFTKLFNKSSVPKDCTASVIEAESVVQFIKPSAKAKSFDEYFNSHLSQYLTAEQEKYGKVLVVFCNHSKNRLIDIVCDERKIGRQQRVIGDAILPTNWLAFLRGSDNKDYLFTFLAERINNLKNQQIHGVGGTETCNSSNITSFNHEDTRFRLFIQVQNLARNGHNKIIIRTIDSSVVVLSISIFHLLCINELWIAYGMPHQFKYIPVHEINASLGPRRSACLPFFDSLTGCGSVSSFNGYGKKAAFDVFMKDKDFIDITLDLLAVKDVSEIEALPAQIEKCVSFLYDAKRNNETVNATRKYLFTIKQRCMEKLPPTRDCLFQHFKRAMYQGILIWGNILNNSPLPPPVNWGWTYTSDTKPHIEPLWSNRDLKIDAAKNFIKCGCKQACKAGRCSCKKASPALNCTLLCACQGTCYLT